MNAGLVLDTAPRPSVPRVFPPFPWEPFWRGAIIVASPFATWAIVTWVAVSPSEGAWHALAGSEARGLEVLAAVQPGRAGAIQAADAFLREHGDPERAAEARRWLTMPATAPQLELIGQPGMEGLTRHRAACFLTLRANRPAIRAKLLDILQPPAVAEPTGRRARAGARAADRTAA